MMFGYEGVCGCHDHCWAQLLVLGGFTNGEQYIEATHIQWLGWLVVAGRTAMHAAPHRITPPKVKVPPINATEAAAAMRAPILASVGDGWSSLVCSVLKE